MIVIVDLFTCIIATMFFILSIKKFVAGKFSILHILIIITYIMQILPILILDMSDTKVYDIYRYPNIYNALLDGKVSVIYDLSMLLVIMLFYYFGNRTNIYTYNNMLNSLLNIHVNKYVMCICKILMFSTVFAVILSPDPSVYLKFSYFYTHSYDAYGASYLYHSRIMVYAKYLSFASILLVYLYKKRYSLMNNLVEYIAAFILMWTDGKRTIVMFLLLGILCIDVLKRTYSSRMIIGKTILFLLIIVMYFILYSKITGKGENAEFISNYIYYYSRLSSVKTSIYGRINKMKMLKYDGQSLVYDICFFIPSRIWKTKPLMFVKYFTSFSCGYEFNSFFDNFNLQVNIWTEWNANFGIIGILIACLLMVFIIKKIEKKNNVYAYLFGTLFCCMYLMFGFEPNVQVVYLAWIVSMIFGKRNL